MQERIHYIVRPAERLLLFLTCIRGSLVKPARRWKKGKEKSRYLSGGWRFRTKEPGFAVQVISIVTISPSQQPTHTLGVQEHRCANLAISALPLPSVRIGSLPCIAVAGRSLTLSCFLVSLPSANDTQPAYFVVQTRSSRTLSPAVSLPAFTPDRCFSSSQSNVLHTHAHTHSLTHTNIYTPTYSIRIAPLLSFKTPLTHSHLIYKSHHRRNSCPTVVRDIPEPLTLPTRHASFALRPLQSIGGRSDRF